MERNRERMETTLEKLTVRNGKTCTRLLQYMGRIMAYDNFDKQMACRVYVDDANDFIAFESVTYKIQFCSNDKKLITLIQSVYQPIQCTFLELLRHVQCLEPPYYD